MESRPKRPSPLAEAELAALEAGREWTRRRLQRDLQRQADAFGEFSPLERFAPGAPAPQPDCAGDDGGPARG
jgi:hypothetical protein